MAGAMLAVYLREKLEKRALLKLKEEVGEEEFIEIYATYEDYMNNLKWYQSRKMFYEWYPKNYKK